jgi:hypothetical protein
MDVGIKIPESLGLYTQVTSYKMVIGMSDEKISPNQISNGPLKCPNVQ